MENNQQLTLTEAWSRMREFWLGLIEEIEQEEQSKNSSQLNLMEITQPV